MGKEFKVYARGVGLIKDGSLVLVDRTASPSANP